LGVLIKNPFLYAGLLTQRLALQIISWEHLASISEMPLPLIYDLLEADSANGRLAM
jgi:hypothetical protein